MASGARCGPVSPPEPYKSSYGRLAGRWDPVELGVHQVIGGGPVPAYVHRPHDALLRVVLDPAVPASRLVVIRGSSSTGKTRAAYETVIAQLADWQLDYPLDPGALAVRLHAGIPARTVLWLGELRQYADADEGPALLARLADLLESDDRLVITTMWPEHWNAYTSAARTGPGGADATGAIGRMLERLPELTGSDPATADPSRGGVIDIPDLFTAAEMATAAATGDSVLAEATAAAASAGQEGQVTQYLAGVFDLLRRYNGPGGNAYGQAIITAAMDATRLGHVGPLPAPLLQDAAAGYLSDLQRTKDIATWRDTALAWATEELNGAVRALQPVPPPVGTGVVGYRVADYLDQHGRRTRCACLGPTSLWDALIADTSSGSDLARLGEAAKDRGLYRHAALLWKQAIAASEPSASEQLISMLSTFDAESARSAARWTADHTEVDDPWEVRILQHAFREAGAENAVNTLFTRAAARIAHDSERVRELLASAESEDTFTTVATQLAPQMALDDANIVAMLLDTLLGAGAQETVIIVLNRRPANQVTLDDPSAITRLLFTLRKTGAEDAVTILAARAASEAPLDDPRGVAELLTALHQAGAENAVTILANRAANGAALSEAGVGGLLTALHQAGAENAVTILANRAASGAALDNAWAAVSLLSALREAGAHDAVTTLATRAARGAGLNYPHEVIELLSELREAGAHDAAVILATRAADQADVKDPKTVAQLLAALRRAGADNAVATLAARAGDQLAAFEGISVEYVSDLLRETTAKDPFIIQMISRAADAYLLHDNDLFPLSWLLEQLRRGAAEEAISFLASRAVHHPELCDLDKATLLLSVLPVTSTEEGTVVALATRAATGIDIRDGCTVAQVLDALRRLRTDDALRTLLARRPADHIALDNLRCVAELLTALREAGMEDAVTTLANRAASGAALDYPRGVPSLLSALREAGMENAVTTLANRAASGAALDAPGDIAGLLSALHGAGMEDAVTVLANRAASGAALDRPWDVIGLLSTLHELGAQGAFTVLAAHAASETAPDLPQPVVALLSELHEAGAQTRSPP